MREVPVTRSPVIILPQSVGREGDISTLYNLTYNHYRQKYKLTRLLAITEYGEQYVDEFR